MTHDKALEKIIKDVEEKFRELRKGGNAKNPPSAVNNDGTGKDTPLSSTRRKRKRSGNAASAPREYMSLYIKDILPDHGWKLKRKTVNGLDGWLATRVPGAENNGRTGPDKLFGLDEIIDEAFVSGLYETYVVGTENGREYLEQAGIFNEPYSIFDEDLKLRRKRRKKDQEETNLLQTESTESCNNGPMRHEGAHARVDNANSFAGKISKIDERGANGESRETKADQTLASDKANDQGVEAVMHKSPRVNPDQYSNGTPADLHAKEGEAEELTGAMRGNINESPADFNDCGIFDTRHDTDVKTKKHTASTHKVQPGESAQTLTGATSPPTGVKQSSVVQTMKEVCQLFKRIKGGLSITESGASSNENSQKFEALRYEFYSHMKSWLVPRVKMVQLSEVEEAHDAMSVFEAAGREFLDSGNDEDIILGLLSCCEVITEDCNKTFPL